MIRIGSATFSYIARLINRAKSFQKEYGEFLITIVSQFLEVNSQTLDTYIDIGVACSKEGLIEAEKLFIKALEIDPNSADVHHNLAVYYYENELYEKALKEWETVFKLNQEYPNLKKNLYLIRNLLKSN